MVDKIMKKHLVLPLSLLLASLILLPKVLLSQTSLNNPISLSVSQTWTALQIFPGVASSLFINRVVPPTIASAGTIAPTENTSFVSGVTAIVTITAPAGTSSLGGCINLIPTGLWTTTTAGNIALASTAVVNRVMTMCYDPTSVKWYPSY